MNIKDQLQINMIIPQIIRMQGKLIKKIMRHVKLKSLAWHHFLIMGLIQHSVGISLGTKLVKNQKPLAYLCRKLIVSKTEFMRKQPLKEKNG